MGITKCITNKVMTQGEITKFPSVRRRKLKREKKWFHSEPLSILVVGNQDQDMTEEWERVAREVGEKSVGVASQKASEGVFQKGVIIFAKCSWQVSSDGDWEFTIDFALWR